MGQIIRNSANLASMDENERPFPPFSFPPPQVVISKLCESDSYTHALWISMGNNFKNFASNESVS